MVDTKECKCIDSIMDGIINSSTLEDMAHQDKPEIILDMAIELKKDVNNIEDYCIVPPKGNDFFRPEDYREAKNNLDGTIESKGRNVLLARKAGIGLNAFLLSNASRMVKCPKMK